MHTALSALVVLGGCAAGGADRTGEPDSSVPEAADLAPDAVKTVGSYATSTGCSTAVVIGLSKQISDEISCMDPSGLVKFAAGSGITITSNAVLPYLAANAKTDLQKVGSVQVNSAFRTVAQQYLLLQWFDRGRCGITAAAAVGQSNHESGRAVDLANYSARISAMSSHGWAHDVAGDPVHFDHLSSKDIRGKDTLAFQRLWNRNHPSDKISEDGDYGPQTEARLKASPATGFAKGASCASAKVAVDLVSVDGPDKIAPGATAHYTLTINNTTDADWPATAQLVTTDGPSPLYNPASWTSSSQLGTLGAAIPAGGQGQVAIDVVAPMVTEVTAVNTELALTDGTTQLGTVMLAVTVTPDGDENTSGDADDETDTAGNAQAGGCAAGGGAGWLAFAPLLVVLRRRRR
ncbi:MAG TPA: hypothetical protein VH165_13405 [Kofleriaceae bacterium]|nr:hypothetical protein [Kofleriaceae bacterium]